MTGLIVRIALRYLAGALVAVGLSDADAQFLAGDPAVVSGITLAAGAVVAAVSEGWFTLAKRFGWQT